MMVEKQAKIIPINKGINKTNTELLVNCYNLYSEVLELLIEKEERMELEKDKRDGLAIKKNP